MSSAPSEECVISSHSHRKPSARSGRRVVGLTRTFNLDMTFVHCEALEPTCQNDARALTSVCALAETCLRGALIEQSSPSRSAGCSHASHLVTLHRRYSR